MSYVVLGLGNPGKEYERTRHNAGAMAVEAFRKLVKLPEFEERKKYHSLATEGSFGSKETVLLLLPQTFMNKSGSAAAAVIKSKKAAEKLIVVHDDLDLPLGALKISFGKNSGGHKGVESIMRALKTKDFIRVRIGVAPTTAAGKTKKPDGEKEVLKFIVGKFSPTQEATLKKVIKKSAEALQAIITGGHERAMSEYNR